MIYRILGVLSLMAGLSLILRSLEIWQERPPEEPLLFIGGTIALVGLCALMAIACLFPRTHPVTLRGIGAIGLIGSLFFVWEQGRDRQFLALLPALFFWLPGSLYLIRRGKLQ
ncbi:hypothetical protein [Geitlerinema sp. PCC 7407]|uniref:hypothetical protein n=1 Tax=Geitlerinema sp. PCC 7407 TaxID=1173025 RepID=UPI00029FFB16|nr:hypothetical protein [Geitlerinema sp. PCC 7407]AFY66237.1 hypothetical protein GEI7407_1750 [Geitlerinema sp. PCC 7407]